MQNAKQKKEENNKHILESELKKLENNLESSENIKKYERLKMISIKRGFTMPNISRTNCVCSK